MMRVLLVVGKSPEWAEDVARFRACGADHDTMGVNHAAIWLADAPKYAFSYHPSIMDEVKVARPEVKTLSAMPSGGVDLHVMLRGDTGGSSSLMAVKLGLTMLGYERVVCAGVSIMGEYEDIFMPAWRRDFPQLCGPVRSMSGNTRELLGEPTPEWLRGER